MRTVTYKSVRDAVARLRGKDPDALDRKADAQIAEHITDRVREGGEFDYWPELTPSERRAYRDEYAAGSAYAAGTELYFPASGNYYQALRATTGNAPAVLTDGVYVTNSAYWAECAASYAGDDWVTGLVLAVGDFVRNPGDGRMYGCHTAHTVGATFDATKFGVLTPFRKYVSLDQTGKTPIGEVLRVCRNDLRVMCRRPGVLNFAISDDGIVPECGAPAVVYVEFRRRMPVFTASVYNAATAYSAGGQCYWPTTGECYRAKLPATGIAPSDTTFWELQQLPYVLATFVRRAALADGLRADGQGDKALLEEQQAGEFLLRAHDAAFAGQGQFDTASARTY